VAVKYATTCDCAGTWTDVGSRLAGSDWTNSSPLHALVSVLAKTSLGAPPWL
jgi:hypothetical protein